MAIMLVSHLHISLLLNTFEKEHGTEIEREIEMERERDGVRERWRGEVGRWKERGRQYRQIYRQKRERQRWGERGGG